MQPSAFERHGYAILPSLIDASAAAFLADYALQSAAAGHMQRGDSQVPDTPCCYADPVMEAVLESLLPAVQAACEKRLCPTYSYVRLYKAGDALERHTDRPSCAVSVSLALGSVPDQPWPLWIESQGNARRVELRPGDGLLYKGLDLPHWREAWHGERVVQLFLHYVDADGPHREWAFDRRPQLGSAPGTQLLIAQMLGL
jgi:hypothetical protein